VPYVNRQDSSHRCGWSLNHFDSREGWQFWKHFVSCLLIFQAMMWKSFI